LSPLGLALLVVAGLLFVVAAVWLTTAGPARTQGVRSLSTAEREAALLKLRQWLDDGGAHATEPVRREAT
jgi:hypothetical protein